MEIGLDGLVYIVSVNEVYRIEGNNLVLMVTIPNGGWEVSLEHSAWGLVANGGGGDYFYRIQPDGALETLINSETWGNSDFALSDNGEVCWRDEGPVCTVINDPYAAWDWMPFYADSMEFGPDGALYYADIDNLYRLENGASTPVLGGAQGVIGTLRLSGSLEGELFGISYTRDKLGRITEKVETIEGETTTYAYGYDLVGRLETVSEDGVETVRYEYDNNGNRTHVDGTLVATYDEQDRLLTYMDLTYSYTDNGELSEKIESGDTTQYTYDVFGNLMQVRLPGDVLIEYIIDGSNRRVGKKVNDELVQAFLYKDQLNPIAELDGNNNIVSRFIYGSKLNVPEYMVKGGVVYRIISDHLGSPRLVVDTETSEIVQLVDYDAWGNVIQDTNPGFQPFGFSGGIRDNSTGLIRFGARDYNPETGKWTSKDPIKFEGNDTNLYAYINGNPVNFTDQSGLGIGLGLTCEAIVGATSVYSTLDSAEQLTESIEVLQDQLDRVNRAYDECSPTDLEKQAELDQIRKELEKAILDLTAQNMPLSDLSGVGPEMLGAGACGLLFFFNPF
ncbi:MAG: RHS repeat-associated core domain-containing protein [Candidatus Thiodiazotropha endolucinida]